MFEIERLEQREATIRGCALKYRDATQQVTTGWLINMARKERFQKRVMRNARGLMFGELMSVAQKWSIAAGAGRAQAFYLRSKTLPTPTTCDNYRLGRVAHLVGRLVYEYASRASQTHW